MSPEFIEFISWIALFIWVWLTYKIPTSYIGYLRYPGSFQRNMDVLQGIKRKWNFAPSCFIWICCSAWLITYKL